MTAYKLVIFDFDGTLADSAPWFISTLGGLALKHGFKQVSRQEIDMLRGKPSREIVRYLGIRFWQMPAIAQDLRRQSAQVAGEIPLFAGVPRLLRDVKGAGARIAIVSSNGEETVRRVLGTSAGMVDHYVCGASLFGKAAKFRALRRTLRLHPREVLSVGDEGRDVDAARKAGFTSVGVTWGYATEAALRVAGPAHTVHKVEELAALVGGTE